MLLICSGVSIGRSSFIRAERRRGQDVVLYKIGDAALPIPLSLSLAVALGGIGVCSPVGLLIIRVLGLPLLPAVTDYLRIQRISPDLLSMVVDAAAPLAFRLAANTLLKSVRRRLKSTLAIGAATGRDQCGSSAAHAKILNADRTIANEYSGFAGQR
jgi:hypothetical protein